MKDISLIDDVCRLTAAFLVMGSLAEYYRVDGLGENEMALLLLG